jgi:actin-related protein
LFTAPELFFDKKRIEDEYTLPEMILNCIKAKDSDLEEEFCKNIVLCGGGSLIPGISNRIERELNYFQENKIKLIAPKDRRFMQSMGASILSSLSSFQKEWISNFEYDEFGQQSLINFYSNKSDDKYLSPRSQIIATITPSSRVSANFKAQ